MLGGGALQVEMPENQDRKAEEKGGGSGTCGKATKGTARKKTSVSLIEKGAGI